MIKDLNSLLIFFIWTKRRPKLKMAAFQLPNSEGGLDLPNIRTYQLPTPKRCIYEWVMNNPDSRWLGVEMSLSRLRPDSYHVDFREGQTIIYVYPDCE